MNGFTDFYESLLVLAKSYQEKNTMLQIQKEHDSDIIQIFGENIDSTSKAKLGTDHTAELAYTTAEHHPFWALLFHCSQISKTTLEKWNDTLSKEELDEIDWSIAELKNTLSKLKERFENEKD